MEQFKQTLPNNLVRLLQLSRDITDMNQFISEEGVNFGVVYHIDKQSSKRMITLASNGFESFLSNGSWTKCFCVNNFTCQTDTFIEIYGEDGFTLHAMTHFYIGCYPIESLFPSTMECFSDNNSCFDIINSIFNLSI